MKKNAFYKETLYYTDGKDRELLDINEQKILEQLSANLAVGVVSGFYEEGYPVYFISQFCLSNLGWTFERFMEKTGGRYLEVIYWEDRELLKAHMSDPAGGSREYRMLTADGEPVWVNEARVDSVAADGRRLWINSVRLVDEIHSTNALSQQVLMSLGSFYTGVYQLDVIHETVYCLRGENAGESDLKFGDWLEKVVEKYHPREQDALREYLSLYNLRKECWKGFHVLDEEFRCKIGDSYGWMTNTLMFDSSKERFGLVILAQRDITNKHLRDNAMLSVVQAFEEIYYVQLEENDYRLIYPESGSQPEYGGFVDAITHDTKNGGIHSEDEAQVRSFLSAEHIREILKEESHAEYQYRRKVNEKDYEWCQISLTVCERINGIPVAVTMAIQSIDDYVREQERQRMLLQDALQVANSANEAKSVFLSRMSHDMRTPLNAVMGMAAIAHAHIDERERVLDCLNKIGMSGRQLLALINDVLDMSKIEAGRISLQEEEFNLLTLFDNMMDIIRPSVEAKGQHVSLKIRDVVHEEVKGDNLRIQQVFMNLMSNAVKYTPMGGNIKVEVSEKPCKDAYTGCFEFIFEDDGIGMSPEFVERIFEPFTRVEDERTGETQGTGLGMAITKNIINMMNGDIRVESRIGEGSRFTVTVFLRIPQENADVEAHAAGGKEAQKQFPGKRVLVVEDNEINREIAVDFIESFGVAVETAENGKAALELLEKSSPGYYNLVFMDIQMPVMDGYEATVAVRAQTREDLKTLPIIAMTANAFAEDKHAAKSAGMNGHTAKPIDAQILCRVLEQWL